MQKRIYRASKRGDKLAVRKLQKLLSRSWYARLLATRQVTQDNQGKKTAGVDGIKFLTPKQRLHLAKSLKLDGFAMPTRRVWIPKPGGNEKRPLGIPAMVDRAKQALAKLALEPEWEAKFEPNSYGFRPGRSCLDAIGAIFNSIRKRPKWVLDADIAKCFDRIDHKTLLSKVNTYSQMTRQIKAWLKAGVFDNGVFGRTEEGTPQGGVISPLLANIALHGMEQVVKQYATTLKGEKSKNQRTLSLVRYADDFVIMHPEKEVVENCQAIIGKWLNQIGLELKEEKTGIVHTHDGFDFLGFNIRQYKTGKYSSKQGFKTLIKPSEKSVKKHLDNLANIISSHKAASLEALVSRLNPMIRGWSSYYSSVVSKATFDRLDNLLYEKLRRWSRRRHPNKSASWVAYKYWKTQGNKNWVFGSNKATLITHSETPIVRHAKVKGGASPYNGDIAYWSARQGKHPETPTRVAKLLKKQKGRCRYCGLKFMPGNKWEVDHIQPRSQGGKDRYDNLQLLHRHCHDMKTASDKLATGASKGVH